MFGTILKKLRNEKNITQKDLAKYLGVSDRSVGYYETGQRTPPPDIIEKIADYFNVSVDYLLGRTNIRTPYKKTTENKIIKDDENELTPEELEILETIKSDPDLSILFHDLKSAPKKKIKQLLKTWEFVNKQFEEIEKELDDGNE